MMNLKVLLKLYHIETLISDGKIFFTVHTTVTKQACSILCSKQQMTHKTNVGNMVSGLPIMTLADGMHEETLDGLRKEYRLSGRIGQADLYKHGHK